MNCLTKTIIALLLILATPIVAADAVQDAVRLYRGGDAAGAYSRALAARDELEGDPGFDFIYGVAAIDSGHPGEGVFALERVLLAFPEDDRARLELARGYFVLEEYARARAEFARVLAHQPPPDVRTTIDAFLDRIRLGERSYRTSASVYAESGFGHDSNVNGAPGNASFFSPVLGTGTLDASSVQVGDQFMFVAAGAAVEHPLAPGRALYARVSTDSHFNQDHSGFDTAFLQGEAGIALARGDHRWRFGVNAQRFLVERATYRDMLGLQVGWRRPVGSSVLAFSGLRFAHLSYPDQSSRDANQWLFNAGLTHTLDGRMHPRFTLAGYGGREDAVSSAQSARALTERVILGASLGGQLALAPWLAFDASVSAQSSRYRDINTVFARRRADALYQAGSSLTWLLNRRFRLRGSLNHYRNDSNIATNDYERTVAQISLRYDYH